MIIDKSILIKFSLVIYILLFLVSIIIFIIGMCKSNNKVEFKPYGISSIIFFLISLFYAYIVYHIIQSIGGNY